MNWRKQNTEADIEETQKADSREHRVEAELTCVAILAQVWCYDTSVVLDGNSLGWQILVQALRMKEILYTQVHFD